MCESFSQTFPTLGAIEDQYNYLCGRLVSAKKRLHKARHDFEKKDAEDEEVLSSLFTACENLRDSLMFLGSEVQDFAPPDATNSELAQWISVNSSYVKSSAQNFGVLAGAAGIEEAFAQLSLSGGSVDPIMSEGFSPSTTISDVVRKAMRSPLDKMLPHWQNVGADRVASFVEEVGKASDEGASGDPTDDASEG